MINQERVDNSADVETQVETFEKNSDLSDENLTKQVGETSKNIDSKTSTESNLNQSKNTVASSPVPQVASRDDEALSSLLLLLKANSNKQEEEVIPSSINLSITGF